MRHAPFSITCWALAALAAAPRAQGPDVSGGMLGGGPTLTTDTHQDLDGPPQLQAMGSGLSASGESGRDLIGAALDPLPGYPMAGILDRDSFINNYVDLDGRPGFLQDFHCTAATYDGHDASDANLLSFEHQVIGVPVFAAQDGTVVATHDGEFDMNTGTPGLLANYVVIDHGGGWTAFYFHLKKFSVIVVPGQSVTAGQQIGMVGSSGNSTGPHLHFSIYKDGQPVEPFGGPCNPRPTLWADQPTFPPRRVPVMDCGFARQDFSPWNPVFSSPREGRIEQSDPFFLFWYALGYLPAQSTVRLEFWRPNGTLSASSLVYAFNNAEPWRGSSWYGGWVIPEMQTIPGTWSVYLYLNEQLCAVAPLEVVQTIPPGFNSPPNPVDVEFSTVAPTWMDPVVCQVVSDHLYDDPDYDLVSYRYLWEVNGAVVRDVTTAALSDVLARGVGVSGDRVRCIVTPGDGSLTGPSDTADAIMGSGLAYPGGGEDLRLLVGVNGPPTQLPEVKTVERAGRLWVRLESPQATFVGGVPILRMEIFRGPNPQPILSSVPGLYLSPGRASVLFDGRAFDVPRGKTRNVLIGAARLAPGGLDLLFRVPAVPGGFSTLIQGTVLHEAAANGDFALSNGQGLAF